MDPLVILDPTNEQEPIGRRAAGRPDVLPGRIGIVDISKPRGDVFCDQLERRLTDRFPGLTVVRLRKPTYTKPAPDDFRRQVTERCEAVIQALAD